MGRSKTHIRKGAEKGPVEL